MRKALFALTFFVIAAAGIGAQTAPTSAPGWRDRVADVMPLLGHRNWILIVDSAYPLQAGPGIETIETDSSQFEVLRHVLSVMDRSPHVRPVITMDAELPFVAEDDAPGVSRYRTEINDVLHNYPVDSLPHDRVIANIEEAAKHFNILVLKTNMTIPYTSVFIRLDCKYWSADAESRMRAKMTEAGKTTP
jgi:L-fucose mutarotase/ribose pyranase (RbsD/FucU family)